MQRVARRTKINDPDSLKEWLQSLRQHMEGETYCSKKKKYPGCWAKILRNVVSAPYFYHL